MGGPAHGLGLRPPGGAGDPDQGQETGLRLVPPNRWSTKEGELCHEVTFTAEDLARDVEPIVATAAHEVAHLWAYSQGVSDVSGNQYHNSEFKKRAEALGLRCPLGRVPGRGWAYTEATEELGQRIRDELQPDYQAFQLFRFLKYISDAFEEAYAALESERDQGADPEDPDEYRAQSIFWVPPEARWQHLQSQARQPTIGHLVDDAMTAVERDNLGLRDVLPKEYGRDALDKERLGQVVDLVSNVKVGGAEAQANDVLGQVYEYFLEQFAIAEGRKGGEFYTPRSVVRLLVEMLEPYQGRVYDPCCGSSGMFVQSVEFIRAHATGNGNGGKAKGDISIYGQESNYTTWRLAKMNLAIRGIEGQIAHGDSFHNDRHPDLRADYILANPPFNVSDWGGDRLRDDKRWEYGVPPVGNANFAWVQHFLYHLAPRNRAGKSWLGRGIWAIKPT